jgi:hypothetical protein
MDQPMLSPQEVAARAREIYERDIRPKVEPQHIGKYLVIDIETGDYDLDADDIAVMKRAAAKHRPDALYGMRIGFPTMGRIGAPRTSGG